MDKHRQPSLAEDVSRVIFPPKRQEAGTNLGHLFDFEAHLCDDACSTFYAVGCYR